MEKSVKKQSSTQDDALNSLVTGYKNVVILTDRQSMGASIQVEMRLYNVLEWVREERLKRNLMPENIPLPQRNSAAPEPAAPRVLHVPDLTLGSLEHMDFAIYTHYRALGRSRPNIFVYHIDNPKSGVPTMLVTDYGNIMLGPDDGSLGMLASYLEARNVPFQMFELDIEQILFLEQCRMEAPAYSIPGAFPARDIYAVTAGLLAGGVLPNALIGEERTTTPKQTVFGKYVQELEAKLRKPQTAYAFGLESKQRMFTNLTAETLAFEQAEEEGAQYKLTLETLKPSGRRTTTRLTCTLGEISKPKCANLYLSSATATDWDQCYLILQLPEGYKFPKDPVYELKLERLQ